MSRVLIKLGDNVVTLIRLIVLKFYCDTVLRLCATREARNGSKGLIFFLHFYAFQSISSRSRHTCLFRKFSWARSANCARAKRARCEREFAAPDCDTSDSDLLVKINSFGANKGVFRLI